MQLTLCVHRNLSRENRWRIGRGNHDRIAEDNPMRAFDAFVDELGLAKLGFEVADPAAAADRRTAPARCPISTATSTACLRAGAGSANGDELAGPRIQPEPRDADPRRADADRSDAGVRDMLGPLPELAGQWGQTASGDGCGVRSRGPAKATYRVAAQRG